MDEIATTDISIIEGIYKFPTEDFILLKELLDSWNVECVYQTCISKNHLNTICR